MSKNVENLKNGMVLISHQLCHLHSVTISIGFRVGSLYESDTNGGITHLLEHLHFRHLYDLNQNELYFKMQLLGAEVVGKTFKDLLSFEITVVPDFFTDAFDLMFRFFMNSNWTKEEFSDEINVVVKQIENKTQTYREWLDEVYFHDTYYSRPTMGNIKTLRKISIKEVRQWNRKYLVPENSCVVITGCADYDMLNYAKSRLQSLSPSGYTHKPVICFPKNFCRRNLENDCIIISSDEVISDVTLFFDVSANLDYETVRLLSSILGEGCGSKLGIELREKSAFTDDVYTELASFYGFNRLSISFNVNNSDFYECIKIMLQVIWSLKYDISNNEILTSLAFFTNNQVMDLDDSIGLNRNYLIADFALCHKISEPLKRKRKYEEIDKTRLLKCARDLFIADNLSLLIETSIPKQDIVNALKKWLMIPFEIFTDKE